MNTILSTQQLQLSIGGKRVCDALDWQIQSGEGWGGLGLNGVGKSTLLHTLCGMHAAHSGTIELNGASLQQLSRRAIAQQVGLLFQHQDELFPTTVFEQVMMGRHPHTTLFRGEQAEDLQRVQRAIQTMELSTLESRRVDTLSGGERRRVAIATILAQQPQLYLLDEPEAHLDPKHQKSIFEQMSQVITQQPRAAMVMALHDINLALYRCTHLLLLFGDGVVEQGRVSEMATPERIERLYGTPMRAVETEGQIAYLAR